jgi:hypothetical protein
MSRNSGSCSAILTHSNTARRYYLRTRGSVRRWHSTATRNRRRGMGCGSGIQGNNLGAPTRSSALLSKGGRARQSTNRGGSSSTEAAQTLVWKSSLATSCFCLVSGSAGTDPLCRSREGRPRHEGFCSSIFCFCSAKPFKGPVVGIIPPPPPCQYPLRRKSKRFSGAFVYAIFHGCLPSSSLGVQKVDWIKVWLTLSKGV